MFTHRHMWEAIDSLGISEEQAGLPMGYLSKRVSLEGRPRWPSCKAVAAILKAADITSEQFMERVNGLPELQPHKRG